EKLRRIVCDDDGIGFTHAHTLLELSPRCITLHAARIGRGAPPLAILRCGGEPSLGPFRLDLDDMPAACECVASLLRNALLDLEHAWSRCSRPERDREMLRVPGRRVDRLLEVHAGV